MRIIICGLNGSGKSTLGRALAAQLGCTFRDAEDYFFPASTANNGYAVQRSREQVNVLLLADLQRHENFIFASVRGNYGDEAEAMFTHAVFVNVPKPIRLERVQQRALRQFGDRVLPGGDLYDQQQRFNTMAAQRDETHVTDWLRTLSIPVIPVDGMLPPEENAATLLQRLTR